MPDFHTNAFANGQYSFQLYANTGVTLDEWRPNEGLIIDGKTLSPPHWHDWGACIGEDESLMTDLTAPLVSATSV